MLSIPIIETERLRLRGHAPDDLDAAMAIWQSDEVFRFITGKPLSRQDVWLRLLRYSGLWDFLGYGYWAVEERASRRYVGQLGFADFRRGLVGFDGRYPEAGWVIHPDYAGRGFASEGMHAACAWLDGASDHRRSFCMIGEDNPRSERVAQKLGYRFALDAGFGDETVAVYTRAALPGSREDPSPQP